MAQPSHTPPREGDTGPLKPRLLTWAALLAGWVEFARSALALPDDAQGRRLRQIVPDIIMLQAVWHALDDVAGLAPDERALGLDRAQVLIDRHAQAIAARWSPERPPSEVRELIDDARTRWRQAAGERG